MRRVYLFSWYHVSVLISKRFLSRKLPAGHAAESMQTAGLQSAEPVEK
jgi:hypothetical protein